MNEQERNTAEWTAFKAIQEAQKVHAAEWSAFIEETLSEFGSMEAFREHLNMRKRQTLEERERRLG